MCGLFWQVEFLICLVLTILGYVPGIIYAIYVIVFQHREEYFDEYRRPIYSAWFLFLWNCVALTCTNKVALQLFSEIWKRLCVIYMQYWKFLLLSAYEPSCYVCLCIRLLT